MQDKDKPKTGEVVRECVRVRRDVFAAYHKTPFIELVALAEKGTDGIEKIAQSKPTADKSWPLFYGDGNRGWAFFYSAPHTSYPLLFQQNW